MLSIIKTQNVRKNLTKRDRIIISLHTYPIRKLPLK